MKEVITSACLYAFVEMKIEGQYPTGWAFINKLSNEMNCTFLGQLWFVTSAQIESLYLQL